MDPKQKYLEESNSEKTEKGQNIQNMYQYFY